MGLSAVNLKPHPVWLFGNHWSGGMSTVYLNEVDSSTIDLYLDSNCKRTYALRSGSTRVHDGPDDNYTKPIHDPTTDEYELFNEQGGEIWVFHDFTVASSGARGLLKKRTTQYRPEDQTPAIDAYINITFCGMFEETNRLLEITISQGWEVDYAYRYDSNPVQQTTDGMVERIDVKNGDDRSFSGSSTHTSCLGLPPLAVVCFIQVLAHPASPTPA